MRRAVAASALLLRLLLDAPSLISGSFISGGTIVQGAVQVLCADAEPLLSAVVTSAPLLRLLLGAPEAWPFLILPTGGPASGAGGAAGGPAPLTAGAAAAAAALAGRWARVVTAVLLRCGRELLGWLEVRVLPISRESLRRAVSVT